MAPRLWSVSGLATELHIDRRTVAKRLAALPPDETNGSVSRWLMANAAPVLLRVDGGDVPAFVAERTRLTREQADRAALENATRRGELVDAEEVSLLWSKLTGETRNKLLGLPSAVAPYLAGKTVPETAAILAEHIREALEALADGG